MLNLEKDMYFYPVLLRLFIIRCVMSSFETSFAVIIADLSVLCDLSGYFHISSSSPET
jgi:hypothetical protein